MRLIGLEIHDVRLGDLGVDLLSLAAHKFGGPKGVGLLYVRDGVALEPVVHGGGQELGRRSGTHNVMGAVGMVTAMELTMADRVKAYAQVAAQEAKDRPIVYLYHRNWLWAYTNKLNGVREIPDGLLRLEGLKFN